MTKQPEALYLSQVLQSAGDPVSVAAAEELSRLHSVNTELLEALKLTNIDCQYLHHDYKDRHMLGEHCPVVARVNAAIKKAEEA